jgi:hypothetical protein
MEVTSEPVRKFHILTVPVESPAARSIVEMTVRETTLLEVRVKLTVPDDQIQILMVPSADKLATVTPSNMAATAKMAPVCEVNVRTGVVLIVFVFQTLHVLSVDPAPVMIALLLALLLEYAIAEMLLPWLVRRKLDKSCVFKLKK